MTEQCVRQWIPQQPPLFTHLVRLTSHCSRPSRLLWVSDDWAAWAEHRGRSRGGRGGATERRGGATVRKGGSGSEPESRGPWAQWAVLSPWKPRMSDMVTTFASGFTDGSVIFPRTLCCGLYSERIPGRCMLVPECWAFHSPFCSLHLSISPATGLLDPDHHKGTREMAQGCQHFGWPPSLTRGALPRPPTWNSWACGRHVPFSLPFHPRKSLPQPTFKGCTILFNLMLFLSLFLSTPCDLQDSSCWTKDETPCPLQWKHGVTTTGLPGKSLTAVSWRSFPFGTKELCILFLACIVFHCMYLPSLTWPVFSLVYI